VDDESSQTQVLSSTSAARSHARSQAATTVELMPLVPARRASAPDGVASDTLLWAETIPGGGYAARRVARGTRLRLLDLEGEANAHVALYNAVMPYERLCVADTVKVLWNAYLSAGSLLLSDQGRVLASVVADTSGRHDTMAGTTSRAGNERRYGDGAAHGPSPAGRELLLLGAAKFGLSAVDLPPTVSFFKGARVAEDGSLDFVGSSGPSCYVDLLAELDLIVVIANTTNPLDVREAFTCGPLQIRAWRAQPTAEASEHWQRTPEGERAFLNTAAYLELAGLQR
jgi:urea carboxylase-associated protein 2